MKKNILALVVLSSLLVSCNGGSGDSNNISSNSLDNHVPANPVSSNTVSSSGINYLYIVSNMESGTKCESDGTMGLVSQYAVQADGSISNLFKSVSFKCPIQSAYLSHASNAGESVLHVLLGGDALEIDDLPIENNIINLDHITSHKITLPQIAANPAAIQTPLYMTYRDFGKTRLLYLTGSSTFAYASEWLGVYPSNQESLSAIQSSILYLFGSDMEYQPFQFDPNKNFGYLTGYTGSEFGGGVVQKYIINSESGLIDSHAGEPRTDYAILDSVYRTLPNESISSYRYSLTKSSNDDDNNNIEITQENSASTRVLGIETIYQKYSYPHTLTIHGNHFYFATGRLSENVSNILLMPLESNNPYFVNSPQYDFGVITNFEVEKFLFLPDIPATESTPAEDHMIVLQNNKYGNLLMQTVRVKQDKNGQFSHSIEFGMLESVGNVVDGFTN